MCLWVYFTTMTQEVKIVSVGLLYNHDTGSDSVRSGGTKGEKSLCLPPFLPVFCSPRRRPIKALDAEYYKLYPSMGAGIAQLIVC